MKVLKPEDLDFVPSALDLASVEDEAVLTPELFAEKSLHWDPQSAPKPDLLIAAFHGGMKKAIKDHLPSTTNPATKLPALLRTEFVTQKIALTHLPVGASAAILNLELAMLLKPAKIIVLGTAAALQAETGAGRWVLVDQAIREEGTSRHYLPQSIFVHPHFGLLEKMQAWIPEAQSGLCWSTDGFFRETKSKLAYWHKKKCLAVDMEMSAILALAKRRQIPVAGLLLLVEEISLQTWNPARINITSSIKNLHGLWKNLDQILDWRP